MIDQIYLMLYNLLFISLPPLVLGVYDRITTPNILLSMPELYKRGRLGLVYRPISFWITMADAFYESIVIFFTIFIVSKSIVVPSPPLSPPPRRSVLLYSERKSNLYRLNFLDVLRHDRRYLGIWYDHNYSVHLFNAITCIDRNEILGKCIYRSIRSTIVIFPNDYVTNKICLFIIIRLYYFSDDNSRRRDNGIIVHIHGILYNIQCRLYQLYGLTWFVLGYGDGD